MHHAACPLLVLAVLALGVGAQLPLTAVWGGPVADVAPMFDLRAVAIVTGMDDVLCILHDPDPSHLNIVKEKLACTEATMSQIFTSVTYASGTLHAMSASGGEVVSFEVNSNPTPPLLTLASVLVPRLQDQKDCYGLVSVVSDVFFTWCTTGRLVLHRVDDRGVVTRVADASARDRKITVMRVLVNQRVAVFGWTTPAGISGISLVDLREASQFRMMCCLEVEEEVEGPCKSVSWSDTYKELSVLCGSTMYMYTFIGWGTATMPFATLKKEGLPGALHIDVVSNTRLLWYGDMASNTGSLASTPYTSNGSNAIVQPVTLYPRRIVTAPVPGRGVEATVFVLGTSLAEFSLSEMPLKLLDPPCSEWEGGYEHHVEEKRATLSPAACAAACVAENTLFVFFGLIYDERCSCGTQGSARGVPPPNSSDMCEFLVCPPHQACGGLCGGQHPCPTLYMNRVEQLPALATAAPTAAPDTEAPETQVPALLAPTDEPTAAPPPATEAPTPMPAPAATRVPTQTPPTALPATAPPTTPQPALGTPMPGKAGTGRGPHSLPGVAPTTAPEVVRAPQSVESLSAADDARVLRANDPAVMTAGAVAATAGIIASSASVLAVGRLLLVTTMRCDIVALHLIGDEPMDWALHPLGVAMGSHAHRYFLAAVVCNLCLSAGFFLLLCGFERWQRGKAVGLRGLSVVPAMLLLPGTVMASSTLVVRWPNAPTGAGVVGLVGVTACVFLPVLLYRLVLRRRCFRAGVVLDSRARCSRTYRLLFGERMWVSIPPQHRYVAYYRAFFETYRYGRHRFLLWEIASTLVLGVLTAWRPPGPGVQCVVRNTLVVLLLGVVCLVLLRTLPYMSVADNVLATAAAILNCVAVSLMTVALVYQPGNQLPLNFDVPVVLMSLSAALSIVKSVLDLVLFCCGGSERRRRAAALEHELLERRRAALEAKTLLANNGPTQTLGSTPASDPAVPNINTSFAPSSVSSVLATEMRKLGSFTDGRRVYEIKVEVASEDEGGADRRPEAAAVAAAAAAEDGVECNGCEEEEEAAEEEEEGEEDEDEESEQTRLYRLQSPPATRMRHRALVLLGKVTAQAEYTPPPLQALL